MSQNNADLTWAQVMLKYLTDVSLCQSVKIKYLFKFLAPKLKFTIKNYYSTVTAMLPYTNPLPYVSTEQHGQQTPAEWG